MADIAAVAATALTAPIEEHAACSLAGPEALSRTEQLRQLGEALGREIPFLEVSREEAVEALAPSMGENAGWYVHNVLTMFAETPGTASTAVEEITGRPATTFARWDAEHTGDFTG